MLLQNLMTLALTVSEILKFIHTHTHTDREIYDLQINGVA